MTREADHTCHWPGCPRHVSPRLWGCRAHWYALPKELRARIWATYRPGQEITKAPSLAYIEAAKAVRQWIHSRGKVRLYRPSNSTQGMGFIDCWCGRCERDRNEDCPILARTFAHELRDPEYPREWCYDANGEPQCTVFVAEGEPVPALHDDRTIDMFGGQR